MKFLKATAVIAALYVSALILGYIQSDHYTLTPVTVNGTVATFEVHNHLYEWDFETEIPSTNMTYKITMFDFEDMNPRNDIITSVKEVR